MRLGIFMGHDLANNYEDPSFGLGATSESMMDSIAARNADHDIWGWKFPAAASYLESLHGHLRNPHLVVVFRDLAATMKGHVRWHNREILHACHDVLMQQQKNWFLLERWRVPTFLVSYEKAILEPAFFATELAQLTGMPKPEGQALDDIIRFLEPGAYK